MRRLTRQKRHRTEKDFRLALYLGGVLLAVGALFVTIVWLERAARLNIPEVPKENSGELVFYNALKNPDSLKTEDLQITPKPVKKAPPEKRPNPEKKVVPVKKAPPVQKAVPVKKAQPPVQPAPKDVKTYAVQVAASKDKKASESLMHGLTKKGYSAYLVHENIPGKGLWYRVRIGRYSEKKEADRMIRRLSDREKLSGFLVVEKRAIE